MDRAMEIMETARMTLTYVFHSCFALETERSILLFDYWMDPANVVPTLLRKGKRIYVFASHFHEDHFTRDILAWRNLYPTASLTYILSKDILRRRRAEREDADVWMAKGQTWQDERLRVIATGSNDSGVSWVIETEGRRIFHAGDLGNWYARFLGEENPEEAVFSEFGEYINPVAEEKRYLGELKDVARLMHEHLAPDGLHFDLAMLPVDGRIGNGYTLGGRQFIQRFGVGLFVPMHFVASGFESAWRMEPFCIEKGIPFWRIRAEGECMEF